MMIWFEMILQAFPSLSLPLPPLPLGVGVCCILCWSEQCLYRQHW